MEEAPVRKAIFFGFAVVMGLILIGAQADVMACGASKTGAAQIGKSDEVKATMVGSYSGGQDAAKDGVIKSAEKTVDESETMTRYATAEFSVKGMTCGGCENQVKTALMNHEGVDEVSEVCHVSEQAIVKYDPAKIDPNELTAIINKLGYKSKYKMASADEIKGKAMEVSKEVEATEM